MKAAQLDDKGCNNERERALPQDIVSLILLPLIYDCLGTTLKFKLSGVKVK